MPLIVTNNTASDIVIDDMGLTIPASGIYDLSARPVNVVEGSQQLANAIATGNVTVTTDTLNVLAARTGYTMLAGGSYATRPVAAANGTARMNTDSGYVEVYANGQWNNLPRLANSVIEFTGIGSLYYKDVANNKFLTVASASRQWVSQDTSNKSWIQIQEAFVGAGNGFSRGLPITVISVQATSDTNTAKSISMFVDDTEYTDVLVFDNTYVPGNTLVASITSFDCDSSQKIRFRVYGGRGSLGAVQIDMAFRIRRTS